MSDQANLEEYNEQEKESTGNFCYGGRRHDLICEELEKSGYTEAEVVTASVGIWKGIEIERAYQENKNTELKAALTDLVKAYLTLSQACGAGIDALNNHAKIVMSLGVDLRGGN